MIDTKNCAKDEVKDTNRQNSLPKTDEMEAESNTLECLVHNFRTIVRFFDKKFVSIIFF